MCVCALSGGAPCTGAHPLLAQGGSQGHSDPSQHSTKLVRSATSLGCQALPSQPLLPWCLPPLVYPLASRSSQDLCLVPPWYTLAGNWLGCGTSSRPRAYRGKGETDPPPDRSFPKWPQWACQEVLTAGPPAVPLVLICTSYLIHGKLSDWT